MRLGTFEEWQLSRPGTPRSVLDDLVREASGAEIAHIDRVVEGYSNEVYRVRCTSGADVVVRILRFDDDVSMSRSIDEVWAIEQARGVGVPAGDVLLLRSISVGGADYPAMVQRAVPGMPLCAMIEELSQDQRVSVLKEVGRLIGLLGSIAVDEPSAWVKDSAATLAGLRRDPARLLDAGIAPDQLSKLLDLLSGYLTEVNGCSAVLSHGDLSTKHIFVGDDASVGLRVSGFIDFGDWCPAPALHDLGVLRVRSPELQLGPILDGYAEIASPARRQQLDLHTLVIALDGLAFLVAERDHDAAAKTADLVRRLARDINEPPTD